MLRELRSDGRLSKIPSWSYRDVGLSERNYATELGAADYVTKAFELDDPLACVRALISTTPV